MFSIRDQSVIRTSPPSPIPLRPCPLIPFFRIPRPRIPQELQEVTKGRSKHGRYLAGIQSRDKRGLRIGILPRLLVVRVQERDAWPDDQLRAREARWDLAQVLDRERGWERLGYPW
jgi:hypothetical protein